MNDRMRRGCCRLLALLLTLVLVIPAYGQETLDALAAAQGCTAETLLQSDKLTAGDSVSDWVAIAVSRTGTEGDTSAYRKALERYVTRMYREQGGLDRLRATEWQRTALTALALGADPTAFGRDKNGRSVNLLADGVYQFTAAKSLGTQGLNGWIFGLIALDSARFAVPEDAVYTRAAILQALVAAQEPEGGFGLTVGNSDVDLTAMTLQALAPYQNSTVTYTGTSGESVTIREVVRRALAWLSDQQTAEGDFISWDAANLESTAPGHHRPVQLGSGPGHGRPVREKRHQRRGRADALPAGRRHLPPYSDGRLRCHGHGAGPSGAGGHGAAVRRPPEPV